MQHNKPTFFSKTPDWRSIYLKLFHKQPTFSTSWINWRNKQQLDQCKIPSDGVPISSGTLAGDLGGITIWNLWSNESDANLEDSACTVRVLLFFPIRKWTKLLNKTEMLAVFKVSQCVKMLSRTFSNMFLRFPEDNLKIIMILKSYLWNLNLLPRLKMFLWYLLS